MRRKISSLLLTAALLASTAVFTPIVSAAEVSTQTVTPSAQQQMTEPSVSSGSDTATEHAYDPIAEREAEQTYRDSTNFVENKLIFSVLDKRKDGFSPSYLTAGSEICQKYALNNVSMVYETRHDESATEQGFGMYEVFYEATVSCEDIWSLVDKVKAEENVASVEPDFIWTKSTEGDYIEATAEEVSKATHFPSMNTENVWSQLRQDDIIPGKDVVVAVPLPSASASRKVPPTTFRLRSILSPPSATAWTVMTRKHIRQSIPTISGYKTVRNSVVLSKKI